MEVEEEMQGEIGEEGEEDWAEEVEESEESEGDEVSLHAFRCAYAACTCCRVSFHVRRFARGTCE